ncbi:MAG: NAD-dependent epimerase/dehydratase family protein [Bacteroidetes bacterium]|nr:MAG: NAD-dependent epimerase/dehydratase family protein [Bacteroidota bacterium]
MRKEMLVWLTTATKVEQTVLQLWGKPSNRAVQQIPYGKKRAKKKVANPYFKSSVEKKHNRKNMGCLAKVSHSVVYPFSRNVAGKSAALLYMVIGNGLLAKAFAAYQSHPGVLIFASGVSNSKLADPAAFQREHQLLCQSIAAHPAACCVYFSTCSIADPSLQHQPYIAHKLHMEQVVQAQAARWLIFRISNVVGHGGNAATIFNFLVQAITQRQPFQLWQHAHRNLIDVEDAYRLMHHFISQGFQHSIINIANTVNHSSLQMVQAIELFTHQQAIYTLTNQGTHFTINTTQVQAILQQAGVSFQGNYLLRLLNTYYHPAPAKPQ